MKTELFKANSRGSANHDWLKSMHTFSFANYFNPNRMGFGQLRVINDDIVEAGMGFGEHPHDNMEIISIPTQGVLEHKDSTGGGDVIQADEVQVMSAGKGLTHSEFNASKTVPVHFFQIWIFPREQGLEPRYDQKKFDMDSLDVLRLVVSPDGADGSLWVNQDTWFNIGKFSDGTEQTYALKGNNHGVFAMVIDGEFTVAGEKLGKRDGIAIENTKAFSLKAESENARILLMEVPMK